MIIICIQTTVRLRPMSYRGPESGLVSAIKGYAIHMPLPMEKTVEESVLPNKDLLTVKYVCSWSVQVTGITPYLTTMSVCMSVRFVAV